ncbi:YfgM family protein [Zobellella maritima]|uniref:YfgM family protein n=1 Tax=Zobellella maritima TaxID=2059725 RepID=UPI000E309E22|nr:tetratricopeptide repeat protein [Zobellella maritima]
MDIYSTEEQQLDALKRWWQEYGKAILLGSVIGLGGLFGWRYYQDYQLDSRSSNAEAFSQVTEQLAEQGRAAFTDTAAFAEQNQGNSYGELAALMLAAEAVKANELPLARQQLELALSGIEDTGLEAAARLRLARVLLAQQQYPAAEAELDKVSEPAFDALKQEILGDLYLAQEQQAAAGEAYRAAAAAGGLSNNPGLQLKMDHLAVSSTDAGKHDNG